MDVPPLLTDALAALPPVPGAPPVPVLGSGATASRSGGGVPTKPVAASAVSDSTAKPAAKVTFAAWCVDRFLGDAQLPTDHPLGTVGASNSSRHSNVKAPSANDEY